MRIIKYLPKVTTANTDYREIHADDQLWLQTELIRWQCLLGQMDQNHDSDSRWVRDQWWHKKSKKLHKGQQGPNTPCSVVAGILYNIMFKTPAQRDFTGKQMEDIEYISLAMAQMGCEAVRFQIGLEHD